MMMMSTPAAPANTTPEKMNGDAAKTASSTPNAGTTSKKVLSDKQKEVIKFNQKRFAQSSSTVAVLLKLAVPAASSLFYTFYSWPKQLIPEDPYNLAKALISAGAKLVLWLGSFVSLAKYTTEDIKTGNWDISSRFADAQFAHRLRIRPVGGVPIIGALGGKYLGYVFSLLSSPVQTGLLLWLQIESWTASAGYSVYLAVEEWAKVVGKLASAISGLTQGGAMYGAGIALFFTTTGCGMQVVRVGLEAVGKRDVLQTGMDLVD